jgi:hypothetical protein
VESGLLNKRRNTETVLGRGCGEKPSSFKQTLEKEQTFARQRKVMSAWEGESVK